MTTLAHNPSDCCPKYPTVECACCENPMLTELDAQLPAMSPDYDWTDYPQDDGTCADACNGLSGAAIKLVNASVTEGCQVTIAEVLGDTAGDCRCLQNIKETLPGEDSCKWCWFEKWRCNTFPLEAPEGNDVLLAAGFSLVCSEGVITATFAIFAVADFMQAAPFAGKRWTKSIPEEEFGCGNPVTFGAGDIDSYNWGGAPLCINGNTGDDVTVYL